MSMVEVNGRGAAHERSGPAPRPADTEVVVRLDQVSKQYGHGANTLLALDRRSLGVRPGATKGRGLRSRSTGAASGIKVGTAGRQMRHPNG